MIDDTDDLNLSFNELDLEGKKDVLGRLFNRFLCWYTMMSKELKIGCCFSTDDKHEATDFTENLFCFYACLTHASFA